MMKDLSLTSAHTQPFPDHYMVFCAPWLEPQVIENGLNQLQTHHATLGIVSTQNIEWLSRGRAAQIYVNSIDTEFFIKNIRPIFHDFKIDVLIVPAADRRKKLLIADMDATIVEGETLDDLAELAGIGEQISAITHQAMRGEIDFEAALRARVALLAGTATALLGETYARMKISEGARALVRTMTHHGSTAILVSGGFTFFTEKIAQICGFNAHHGNEFAIENGILTGEVAGHILDKGAKLEFLKSYQNRLGLRGSDLLAVGDGANDLPMIQEAAKSGLGIGYHPKPIVAEHTANLVCFSDLTALLYIQGYTEAEIL